MLERNVRLLALTCFAERSYVVTIILKTPSDMFTAQMIMYYYTVKSLMQQPLHARIRKSGIANIIETGHFTVIAEIIGFKVTLLQL